MYWFRADLTSKNIKHILNAVLNPAMCQRQRYTHSEFILWYSQYVKGNTTSSHFCSLPTCSCIKYHCSFSHLEGNTDYALSEIMCKRTRCTKSVKCWFCIFFKLALFDFDIWLSPRILDCRYIPLFSYTPGCQIPLIMSYTRDSHISLIVIYPSILLQDYLLTSHEVTCMTPVSRDVIATGCSNGNIIFWFIEKSAVDKM